MATPTTSEELVELMRKSGIIEEKLLTSYVENHQSRGSLPEDPRQFAEIMVQEGLLTGFQVKQFLLGRWKRFTIGKYKVLEEIGRGGMGSVFLCEHKFMRRRAAVKVLPAAKASDPSALERFYREARAVAALDHPNIVRAYDIDVEADLHFLVMEYVDGASLIDIVRKVGPISPVRVAHYVSQAALGLQHAHDTACLVHRDIKPGNVIVDRTGVVKVLDLGLARFFKDEDDLLTKKYDENVLGTADYLAPEQVLDSHGVDIRADVYSLGATAYFCLTGLTPFGEGTVAQKLIWHQTRKPKPILSIRPDVPQKLVAVIEKMMAKSPEDRYQNPIDVVEALKPWTTVPIPPPPAIEMPQLSLAARRWSPGSSIVGTDDSASPMPRVLSPEDTLAPRMAMVTPVMPMHRVRADERPASAQTPMPADRPPTAPRQAKPSVLSNRQPTPVARSQQVKEPGPKKSPTPPPPKPTGTAFQIDKLESEKILVSDLRTPARTGWLRPTLLFVAVVAGSFLTWWVASGQAFSLFKH
jgi:serine/threonine protein kinase